MKMTCVTITDGIQSKYGSLKYHRRRVEEKKTSEKSLTKYLDDPLAVFPQPQWKEMKKFRDWWWDWGALGRMDSPVRRHIVAVVEQYSWSACTKEEDILFFLLRLTIDTKIELSGDEFEKFSEWCEDLAQIISQLGPFPLQKLLVTHDSLSIQPVLVSIVQQSPYLQVVQVNQWALNNDFMNSLGCTCKCLTEFSIPFMKPQVFMSDEALFMCFFGGQSSEEVVSCWRNGEKPRISFPRLKYVDILFWKETEKFIQMLSVFYPSVRLRAIDAQMLAESNPVQPFTDVGAQVTAAVLICRLGNIVNGHLDSLLNIAPFLKELRVHIDDSFQFNVSCSEHFKQQLEDAANKLRMLVSKIRTLDTLALCPYHDLKLYNIILPTLQTKGNLISSLHISFEYSIPNEDSIYKVINHCPNLSRLSLFLPPAGLRDSSSKSCSLKPCQALQTLVIHYLQDSEGAQQEEEPDQPEETLYIDIVMSLLMAAPHLKVFGVAVTPKLEAHYYQFSSSSVHTLHIHMVTEPKENQNSDGQNEGSKSFLESLLFQMIPKFPRVQTLSIDPLSEGESEVEVVSRLCRSSISVTRWRPEFFQELSSWDTFSSQHNLDFNFHVM